MFVATYCTIRQDQESCGWKKKCDNAVKDLIHNWKRYKKEQNST